MKNFTTFLHVKEFDTMDANKKRSEQEKRKLEEETKFAEESLIKTSQASAALVKSIKETPDPFAGGGGNNPFTRKPGSGGGGCTIL